MSTGQLNGNSWTEHRRLILSEIEKLRTDVKDIKTTIMELQVQMAISQTRQSTYSGIVSIITSVIVSSIIVAVLNLVLK
jgi:hypothetical protein